MFGNKLQDISFSVEDLDAIMERAKQRGCKIVDDIWEESDEHGKVMSTLSFLSFFLSA
jgi:4-hydroxyphenylpyruvate dioxygenase